MDGDMQAIAEPIPMKRELKRSFGASCQNSQGYCRAYPDEKGIETTMVQLHRLSPLLIAEPIPMKRELKHVKHYLSRILRFPNCRAYPDEKGIETPANMDDRIFRGQALQSLSR